MITSTLSKIRFSRRTFRALAFAAPVVIAGAAAALAADEPAKKDASATISGAPLPEGYELIFSDDFEDGDLKGWTPSDPKAFGVVEDGGRKALSILADADYKPVVRSPQNIAVAKDVDAKDFVIEVRLKSTTKDYNHRDMCVIFDYQDPSKFYYVHFALKADAHANSIFIVNDAPRLTIAEKRTDSTRWTEDYHVVRIARRADSGEIEIYFDDMTKPAMTAKDKTFTRGAIGVGSFDDTGNIDEVKMWRRSKE